MGIHNSNIVSDSSLVLCLDAANVKSYPGAGTTWFDISGRQNNGTLVGSPTFSGGSFTFDGVSQHVDLGTTQFNTASGTIDFWIKLTNTIDSATFTGNQRPFGSNDNFEMRWGGNTPTSLNYRLGFDLGISQTPAVLETSRLVWSNAQWYNIVAVWNSASTTSAFYVNGDLEVTGTTPSTATLTAITGTTYIGRSPNGFVAGQIPLFKIYNRNLSASEVQQNFMAMRGRFSA